ncbi:MAG TPA: MarR family transcriptional regulator [Kofleriaceae bacterium]|nr:MarR family transcriptional regulator [Kofleriaceae bacterium]
MQDDRLRSSLANAVVRLFRQVNRVHNRLFADHDVSAEQAHILLILGVYGPMTIGRLQKQLSLSSATLTGAIDRLEAQELVRRVPSPRDGRAFVIESRLPDRKRAQLEAIVEKGDQRCFSALNAGERKELLRLLEKCAAQLEETAAAK